MDSYVVLARKWRPAQFSDIVGQSHVVRTLMNAIRAERVHQAYLFTGSRGIGKTSIARIFAKAIRCPDRKETPELESCGKCPSCLEITNGNGVDVIEIDGASNNGVDAVREIRENAKYLPSSGERKIYIIDEVHMLTTAAFNALLKTLEEPPPHVIFIFATTEPHKIPATILSRCQRFDFRRVTAAQIQNRLEEVVRAEGFEADAGALALIGRAAEGSMRDALSLLDQVIAFSGKKITTESARQSVGLIEGQTLLGILRAVFARDAKAALMLATQAYQQGHDLRVLAKSVIEYLHGAILAKVGADGQSLEISDSEWSELKSIAELRTLEEMEMIFQVFHHGLNWIAHSPQQKVILDILLIKCATAEALVRLADENTAPMPAEDHGSAAPASVPLKPAAQAMIPVKAAPAPTVIPVMKSPQPAATPTQAAASALTPAATTPTWLGFIDAVRKSRPLLASLLEFGAPPEIPAAPGENLRVLFSRMDAAKAEQLNAKIYSDALHASALAYFGRAMRLEITTSETAPESLAAKRERERQEKEAAAKQTVENHPLLREARSLFGGEMDPIEWTGSEAGHD